MAEEPRPPASEEPRFCPACGARVAARATTCLMCGAPLTGGEEEEAAPQRPPVRQASHLWFWLAVVAAVALVGTVGVTLLRPLLLPPAISPTPTATHSRPTTPPTATPPVTSTPTPTATPLPPRAHQVQPGETLSDIAVFYETTVEEILALNPNVTPELLQPGQVLLIPPIVPTPTPTRTPGPAGPTPTAGGYVIHVVGPGETLISIAAQYSVTVALIRAANPDIPVGSDILRPNQSLIIPVGTPMPTPTPTPNPNATPTPLPPYPPPTLLTPADGATFGGPEAVIVLQWTAVGLLRANEWYELRLTRPGHEPVVVRTWSTAYRVPADLYPADSAAREFRWQVRVVRRVGDTEVYERASEPGEVRTFLWLAVTPTPLSPSALHPQPLCNRDLLTLHPLSATILQQRG